LKLPEAASSGRKIRFIRYDLSNFFSISESQNYHRYCQWIMECL